MKAKELDVVKLKNGGEATILEVFAVEEYDDDIEHYYIEIADKEILQTISEMDIDAIIYKHHS